jgi:hypothetical protein
MSVKGWIIMAKEIFLKYAVPGAWLGGVHNVHTPCDKMTERRYRTKKLFTGLRRFSLGRRPS